MLFFISFLPVLHSRPLPSPLPGCPRALSREATFASQLVIDAARYSHVHVSNTCALLPELGKYFQQENAKSKRANLRWTCLKCRKTFFSEDWLDFHMHAQHGWSEQREPREWIKIGSREERGLIATDGVCLADYCDVLGCESFTGDSGMDLEGKSGETFRERCLGLLLDCFPGSQSTPFFSLQFDQLCESPFNVKVQRLRLKAAERGRFKWTTGRILSAGAVTLVFLWMLLKVIEMDRKNPMKGVKARKKEGEAPPAPPK